MLKTYQDVIRLTGELSDAHRALENARLYNYNTQQASLAYAYALRNIQPIVDLIKYGEAVATHHVVIYRSKNGPVLIVPTATPHEMARRLNADWTPADALEWAQAVESFHE